MILPLLTMTLYGPSYRGRSEAVLLRLVAKIHASMLRVPYIGKCSFVVCLSFGSENLPKTGLLWRDILAVWQPLQERHHLAMSIGLFMPCQTNLVLISGFVALCDGCLNPCKHVKTVLRNFAVMYGRMCPVDTSHQIKLLSNDLSN